MLMMTGLRRRAEILFGRRGKAGAHPGMLHIPEDVPHPRITVLAYGPDGLVEESVDDPTQLVRFTEKWPVTWINVDGTGNAAILTAIGEAFGLHALALEDVVNTNQRAKVEAYDDQLFIVMRMVGLAEALTNEQVAIFLGDRYVITLQERPGDCLDIIRERVRKGRGRIRSAGTDYLAYAIIDAIVDHYFPVLEAYGDRIDALEEDVVASPTAQTARHIHDIKHDLLALRRAAWPLRDALSGLYRDELPLIRDETRPYLRDAYDHSIQALDVLETYRELASGLRDAYMSSLSNRMNDVMRVLTLFASVFIPLTFVAGVYGMNFDPEKSPWNMPELRWYWGYPAAIGVMAAAALGLLAFFWRKGWLGRGWMSRAGRRSDRSG